MAAMTAFAPVLLGVLSALSDVPLPNGVTFNTDTVSEVNYGRLLVSEASKSREVRGPFSQGYAESEQRGTLLWNKWKPLLLAKGWKLVSEENGHHLVRGAGAKEQRLVITTPDFDAPRVQLIEVGGRPMKLDVKPPGAKAEAVKDDADFPFAPVFPGQARSGSMHADVPFIVGPSTEDPRFIAEASDVKTYAAPKSLSRLEAVVASADALKRAGWDVAVVNEEDGYVQAHFTKNGRDLWLHVSHREDGTDQALSYSVVDLGADDLGKQLDKDCKLTLRGVNFDFNKATLKSDSEVTLGLVAKALSARASLKLDVNGHTDSVGDDASNQKLSEARAAAVVAWLGKHGVAAGRLTARGYGESQPISDNDSDAGRARNRRVELVCVK
jgi:outer membrane protein OmpA-like peptidoglycan-associated protein